MLASTILPKALECHSAAIVSEFEQRFERIGLPALAVQIVTGLWLAEHLLGSPGNWFEGNPVARRVQVKLGLPAVTIGLAVHARFRVIPNLSDATLPTLAWHVRIVALAAVLFVLAGGSSASADTRCSTSETLRSTDPSDGGCGCSRPSNRYGIGVSGNGWLPMIE